jgi:hypothetical protein
LNLKKVLEKLDNQIDKKEELIENFRDNEDFKRLETKIQIKLILF